MSGRGWKYSGQNGVPGHCMVAQVWDSKGRSIAQIEPTAPAAKATARARVMAAAPELLEAGKEFVQGLLDDSEFCPGCGCDWHTEPHDLCCTFYPLMLAIAKAEGK